MRLRIVVVTLSWLVLAFPYPGSAQEGQLPFRTAIELALKNSTATGIAQADVQRAQASYLEARDLFVPQLQVGADPAKSYGFPLSIEGAAPSLFDVNLQGFLLNFGQREFMKAAKTEIGTARAQGADVRSQVIMETAIDYIQLDLLESSLAVQREQQQVAVKFEDVTNQRVQAGIDAPTELTRAKLAGARTRMEMAQSQAAIDQLRLRLSQLTGLPQSAIHTATESIPEFPAVSQSDDLGTEATRNNSAVKVAEESASAKEFRAKGEEKQLYPAVDLVAHYGLFSDFNNFSRFFNHFQPNNLVVGVSIRVPLFNSSQHQAAKASEADALKARKEAQNVKDQVSTETLRLQRTVDQLSAAREVYKLEHQLAEADAETTHEKIQTGGSTLKDEENAKITEHERYAAYLNSSFDLDKAQIQLLRQIGQLESWALGPRK